MTFDPFLDFETRGYLRNVAGERNLETVKRLEHRSFLGKLDGALEALEPIERLSYGDVLATHRRLFEAVYPWAGQDRSQTAPDLAISKGPVLFAHPADARRAVEHGLRLGQDTGFMAERPGEVMGHLAYGHPFLDGNGRALMVVHTELAHRAGISINWAETGKAEYLAALTREIDAPGQWQLDAYLKPYVGRDVPREQLAARIAGTPGLSGAIDAENQILGRVDDPKVEARYEAQRRDRGDTELRFFSDLHPENDRGRDR